MKITVITVCYNSVATIGDALRSVAAQTYPDIEHIVIDGGSRDGTQDAIRANIARVAQFVSERDEGIYDAMNKGLARATGDVICFLNSDDFYASPEALAVVACEMNDPSIDALFGDVAFIDPINPEKILRHYRSGRFSPRSIAWGWMPAHPASFIRRTVFEIEGGFKTDYRIAADFEFIARSFGKKAYRFRHSTRTFVKMRLGGVSTGGFKSKILLNREVLRACRENGIRTSYLQILMKYPFKILEYVSPTLPK
ncbi:glycosyltransferase [Rhizobium grahamii]|uniref:Glycosyltransferase n=1 Tax=Rhizobium grahamii TaxID=1120045 RepID=A0A5Q0C993_9HYPH|nr:MULTISPECIES: glycosyltransferase family 2 protein [Rhizobium]QFY62012.1 glycosyltransferase [Rhizobium grahamii]QRM48811.1 glycosyltransferase [Rhizobium sp. BG6]